jgi:uncharacterized coiled-coil protein SlyX
MQPADQAHLESRLQEGEIKLAFLEKELEEYKAALQEMHARVESVEARLKRALASGGASENGSAETATPDHFAS